MSEENWKILLPIGASKNSQDFAVSESAFLFTLCSRTLMSLLYKQWAQRIFCRLQKLPKSQAYQLFV
jgi:hypothetical protein